MLLKVWFLFVIHIPLVSAAIARSLTVCTAGDYPPLTHFSKHGGFQGLAPTLLENFASSQNYTVEFVLTPWADLQKNLRTKCLLAAGGITWTQGRAEEFLTSVPLETSRKAPVFSARSAEAFDSFKDINQQGVSIIENHGGTNERYAQALFEKGLLTEPTLEILPTNQEAYACLRQCSAHPLVMFTDSIEVEFEVSQPGSTLSDKGLRIAMPELAAFKNHKVYLARNSSVGHEVMQELNSFLVSIQADGRYGLWKRQAFSRKYPSPAVTCTLKLCTEDGEPHGGSNAPPPGLLL